MAKSRNAINRGSKRTPRVRTQLVLESLEDRVLLTTGLPAPVLAPSVAALITNPNSPTSVTPVASSPTNGPAAAPALVGNWSAVTAPPTSLGTMLLLPNGNVMAQGGGSANWYMLKPDATGNYANGTWSQLASMSENRLYFGSVVLGTDKVLVLGGEYSGTSLSQTFDNTGEIYDIKTNTWTSIANFPQSQFGDDPTVVLPNGKILAGYLAGPQTYLYDPTTNSWSNGPTKLNNDASDEETWVKLPNGKILSYSIFDTSGGVNHAQIYDPTTNTWSATGNVPVPLSDSTIGYELGGGLLLPNGKVLQLGANGNSALYDYTTNTWSAGPQIKDSNGTLYGPDDAPASILPDGQVVFAADAGPSSGTFSAPTKLFNYDYVSNTISQITTGLPSTLTNDLNGEGAYVTRSLVLPSGQLLFNDATNLFVFTPSDSPLTAWKPTITSVVNNSGTYTLTGTQLSGISEGSSYGDNVNVSENYPIVQLTATTGNVYYATTSNWSSVGVSAVGDTTPQTVNFTLPGGLPNGTYQLAVIANGIASTSQNFVVGATTTTGTITGRVFDDVPHAGLELNSDPGLGGWEVYLDVGNVGHFVATDPHTLTAANGTYTFSNVAAGTVKVGEIIKTNYVESVPTTGGEQAVTVTANTTTSGVDFGDYLLGQTKIADDGDIGGGDFTTSGGNWKAATGGYGNFNHYHQATATTGAATGTWSLAAPNGGGAGTYELYATWVVNPAKTTSANNATYLIYDAGTGNLLGQVTENQQVAPDQVNYKGLSWQKLGDFTSSNGNFKIVLDSSTTGSVDADAVMASVRPPLPSSQTVLFYGGNYDPSNANSNSLVNERNTAVAQSSIYQNFVVPTGQTWTINALYSNDQTNGATFQGADWSISAGLSEGNGGTVIASGTNAPVAITATGRVDGFGNTEYSFAVNLPTSVVLGPGTYWMNVTPVGNGAGQVFNSDTFGLEQIGTDISGQQFWNSSTFGANYTNANNATSAPQFNNFSDGVIGTVSVSRPAPSPPSLVAPAPSSSSSAPAVVVGGQYAVASMAAGQTAPSSTAALDSYFTQLGGATTALPSSPSSVTGSSAAAAVLTSNVPALPLDSTLSTDELFASLAQRKNNASGDAGGG